MKTLLLLISIVGIILFSCNSSSEAVAIDNSVPKESNTNLAKGPSEIAVYDIIVSFISKGAGIDRGAVNDVNNVITQFSKKNGVEVMYKKEAWGKEGEMDYNFNLKNLSTADKQGFIKAVEAVVSSTDMANIKFNQQPVHKR